MEKGIDSDTGAQDAPAQSASADAREDFIVAVRREKRDAIALHLAEVLAELDDVEVQGSGEGARVLIRATSTAVETIRARYGSTLHVEHVITHSSSAIPADNANE